MSEFKAGDRVVVKRTLLWDNYYGTVQEADPEHVDVLDDVSDDYIGWSHVVLLDVGTRIIGVYENQIEKTNGEESNLLKHAAYELNLLGENLETISAYLKMVKIFSDMGHSGASAYIFTYTLSDLLWFKNLKPLTDDPDEWHFHDTSISGTPDGFWQNKRNSAAFSNDEGKTYWLTSEGGNAARTDNIMHKSEAK